MTTMGHLSVWRWKDVLLGGCLFCNFDFFFFFFSVYLSLCVSLYLIKGYWWSSVKWSQFSIFDRKPPSSCEKATVCFIASAITYFHWLVIQWGGKTCSSMRFLIFFLYWYFTFNLLRSLCWFILVTFYENIQTSTGFSSSLLNCYVAIHNNIQRQNRNQILFKANNLFLFMKLAQF